MPVCVANGISLYYQLAGSGERLLLISGTGQDLRRARLAEGPHFGGFEVLQYDQRGLGQSEVPEGPYTMADYANDAAGLLDVLGWEDCVAVGVSFGGMVAQELALRHPARVRRLVLACTSAGGVGGSSYPLHELSELGRDEAVAHGLRLIDTRWDAAWQKANPDTVRMVSEGFQLLGRGGDGSPVPKGLALQLEARRHHDTAARLGRIGCPTLVCGGRFDGIAPPANSEFLVEAIGGAQLQMFDGGHAFFLQDPAAMPAIVDFLRSESRQPSGRA